MQNLKYNSKLSNFFYFNKKKLTQLYNNFDHIKFYRGKKNFIVFFFYMSILVLIYYIIIKNRIIKIRLKYAIYLIKANIAKDFVENSKYNDKSLNFSYFKLYKSKIKFT